MSFTGQLNQTVTIYTKSGYDLYGREEVGSGTDYNARVQEKTKQKLLPDGSLLIIDAKVFLAGDVSVARDDRIDFGDNKFKVWSVYKSVDGKGDTHHLELELIKWKET